MQAQENNRSTFSDTSFYSGRKVWITGHGGMLGSAMVRNLREKGADLLLTSRAELDLTDQAAVLEWAKTNKPDLIFHIAAKVGGIYANATLPSDFLRENLLIQTSVIDAAYKVGAQKLVFVASNCTYPTLAKNPISEDALLTGMFDQNIRAYAISKIAGIEMCRAYNRQHGCDFISVIPPNLYGPGDNYHPEHGHVVAGILRRIHEAKQSGSDEFVVWGDGTPRRELLHVDDLASALDFVMRAPTTHDLYNIGCGHDLAIADIAKIASEVIGFQGNISYDTSKPNGTMRKLLDSSRIQALGWTPVINEHDGMQSAYIDFLSRH